MCNEFQYFITPGLQCESASFLCWLGFGSGCCCEEMALDFPASVFWWYCYCSPALHPARLVCISPCSSLLLPQACFTPAAAACGEARPSPAKAARRPGRGEPPLIRAAAGQAARRAALCRSAAAGWTFRVCSKLFLYFILFRVKKWVEWGKGIWRSMMYGMCL